MIAECKETRPAGGLTVELQAGLSAAEADTRVAQAHRAGDIGAMALSFYLVDMADRGVHQELGFHGIEQYAEMRYQIRPATTRRYLVVGRALRELPEIHRAIGEGRLFWSQVREIVRVAVPETEHEWIEWARNRSAREITAQVSIRRKGERPTDPARRRIHNVWFRPEGRMNALQWAKWNTARAKLEAELGRPVSDTEMLEQMSDLLLSTRADGSVPGRMPVNDSHYSVVTVRDAATGITSVETEAGLVELDTPDPGENRGPEIPIEQRDQPTPPWLRREILARDGFRCLNCLQRRNLTIHHLIWLIFGGLTVPENLLTVCDDCHSLIHADLLVVRGTTPGGLRFLDSTGQDLRTLGRTVREVVESMIVVSRETNQQASDQPGIVSRETNAVSDQPEGVESVSRETNERRPRSLVELVGQHSVVANLRRAVRAARRRGENAPHILLAGPPGLGKTSIAHAVAGEMGRRIVRVEMTSDFVCQYIDEDASEFHSPQIAGGNAHTGWINGLLIGLKVVHGLALFILQVIDFDVIVCTAAKYAGAVVVQPESFQVDHYDHVGLQSLAHLLDVGLVIA